MSDSSGHVNSQTKNKISTIEFYHPAHNSLPSDLLSKLASEISQAGKNDDCLLIVLKSAGDRSFCAGASFTELVELSDATTSKRFFMGFAGVINAIRTCGKIVIGRVLPKFLRIPNNWMLIFYILLKNWQA